MDTWLLLVNIGYRSSHLTYVTSATIQAAALVLSAVAGVGGVAGPHCKLVRSPYPISEECFPVPECEHRCDVVS